MNEQDMPQKIMTEIHRLVQKLKEGGMAVDSALDTKTKVLDGTVKYTDSLTLTGKIEAIRLDPRSLEQVKEEHEAQKAEVQAQSDALIAKFDEVIAIVEPEIAKAPVVEPEISKVV